MKTLYNIYESLLDDEETLSGNTDKTVVDTILQEMVEKIIKEDSSLYNKLSFSLDKNELTAHTSGKALDIDKPILEIFKEYKKILRYNHLIIENVLLLRCFGDLPEIFEKITTPRISYCTDEDIHDIHFHFSDDVRASKWDRAFSQFVSPTINGLVWKNVTITASEKNNRLMDLFNIPQFINCKISGIKCLDIDPAQKGELIKGTDLVNRMDSLLDNSHKFTVIPKDSSKPITKKKCTFKTLVTVSKGWHDFKYAKNGDERYIQFDKDFDMSNLIGDMADNKDLISVRIRASKNIRITFHRVEAGGNWLYSSEPTLSNKTPDGKWVGGVYYSPKR